MFRLRLGRHLYDPRKTERSACHPLIFHHEPPSLTQSQKRRQGEWNNTAEQQFYLCVATAKS